ncbi:hypothetical protein [Mycoplasma suis]|uniref:Uncharacterized protein n=1 Tax=Mycoplasma suis (strain Illinois) TaxID=768700 RepID=F0QQK1_MYCSL|nr:hypothetical protein [Mycoplasma suis]ADX97771.1 hypothetical protein MSU_0227 [Mycoplasma suis str. Illinois]
MLGGLSKKFILIFLGISGIFGGSGVYLMNNSGSNLKSIPKVDPNTIAEYIYKDQESQLTCDYWINNLKDSSKKTKTQEECLSLIKEVVGEEKKDKPIKWLRVQSIHFINIFKRLFFSSATNDVPWENYLSSEQWIFKGKSEEDKWLCSNSTDSSDKVIISCERTDKNEIDSSSLSNK